MLSTRWEWRKSPGILSTLPREISYWCDGFHNLKLQRSHKSFYGRWHPSWKMSPSSYILSRLHSESSLKPGIAGGRYWPKYRMKYLKLRSLKVCGVIHHISVWCLSGKVFTDSWDLTNIVVQLSSLLMAILGRHTLLRAHSLKVNILLLTVCLSQLSISHLHPMQWDMKKWNASTEKQ